MHLTVPTALLASTMIMLAHSGSLAGKDAPKAEIKISYNYRHLFFRGSDGVVEINNRYILLANQKESKFYSPQTEYLDSLDSTPEGRAASRQLMDIGVKRYLETGDRSAVPHNDGDIYVFKSIPETETEVYDRAGMIEFGHYTEPFAEMEWAIGDSTKNLLGYECIMATTDYHGRHWNVWFTPDIPIHDGPWKLCGLPGLILEANETDGQHSFIADGIEKSDRLMQPVYGKHRYEKMNRIDMLKSLSAYYGNMDGAVRAALENLPDGKRSAISKAPAVQPENTQNIDLIETDYRK